MSTAAQQDLRYPVGTWQKPEQVSETMVESYIADIRTAAGALRKAVAGLKTDQLDTPYRPGGWTVRQVVHHVADSHMNSYVRFRLALTEDEPTIKTYDENRWAALEDAATAPVDLSLDLVQSMHRRWVLLLESFGPKEWGRTFRHPDRGLIRLDVTALLYAWHGKHHFAHVMELRKREGWVAGEVSET